MKIAALADSHLSPHTPECWANWVAAEASAVQAGAGFGVHLGDITLDAVSDPSELASASQRLNEFPMKLYCIPGNHDVASGSGEEPVDERMLDLYGRHFGADRWCRYEDGWLLCGLNAQLFGSGTSGEAEQWQWLAEQTAKLAAKDQWAVFVHRPLVRMPSDTGMPTGRYAGGDAASRLLAGPAGRQLRLVVSGHVHQALDVEIDGVRHVWAPSIGFVIADHMQQPIGRKRVGMTVITLDGPSVTVEFTEPPGVVQHQLHDMAFYRRRQAVLPD